MDKSLVGLMDTKCPHPITNVDLQKWTDLRRLEDDFERYTKASLEYFDPHLALEACEIFKVPADFERTDANIIDLRLCAYIRFLEVIAKHKPKNDLKTMRRFYYKIHSWPNIFIEIDDGPDVRWFFRHRVMEYVRVQIDVWPEADFYRGKAMSMLHLLLGVARDRNDWDLFDESLAALLRHPRDDIRTRSNVVFALLIRYDATKLEDMSKHFDAFLAMYDDPSAEVRASNKKALEEIARNIRFGPHGRRLLRRVADLQLQKLDKLIEAQTTSKISQDLSEQVVKYMWLIMPRLDPESCQFDLTSESDQVFEYLKLIIARKGLFKMLCERFYCIYWDYVEEIKYTPNRPKIDNWYRKVVIQYSLVLGRAGFMLAKHFDATELDGLAMLVMGDDPDAPRHHYCNSKPKYAHDEAEHLAYCELLSDIFNHLNDRAQTESPKRFRLFFSLLQHVGYLKWNEERMRAMESCIKTASKHNIKLDHVHYLDAGHERCLTCRRMLAPLRLAYFDRSREKLIQLCDYSNWEDDLSGDIEDIQSRRLILVSMCKLSVLRPWWVFEQFVVKMLELLGVLQFAYKLRSTRVYNRRPAGKLLLPTCTELAFPSPFDNPESSIYICEFAFFKDTLNFLKRREAEVFERTVSKLNKWRRKQLVFYLEAYDGFDACCAATCVERGRAQFQCIEHRIVNQSEPKLCPLLKREPFLCEC